MRDRIGHVHRACLLSLFAILLSFFLVGFAKPRDPRVSAIVVPDLGGETLESAAKKQMTRADGVVLLVAVSEHQMRIETGPRARSLLSDEATLRIMEDRMRPLLREGRTDEAVDAGVAAIEEALRARPTQTTWSAKEKLVATGMAAFIVLALGALALGGERARSRKTSSSSSDVVHVPYVDTASSSSGFSGGGGASSSW